MAQYIEESVTPKVDYIYDMKVKIYNYIMSIKDNPELQDEFSVANSIYSDVVKLVSYEDIKKYYAKLYNESQNHVEYKEYNKLIADLKTEKDATRRRFIHDRLKVLVRRINGRHNILNIIDNYLKEMKKNEVKAPVEKQMPVKPIIPGVKPVGTSDLPDPIPVKSDLPDPIPQKKNITSDLPEPIPQKRSVPTQNKQEQKPVSKSTSNTDPLVKYMEFSNNIIRLLDKYNSLDKNTSEALSVRMKINEILDKREQALTSRFGPDVMVNLSVLESLEERISRLPLRDNTKPYQLDEAGYNKEILSVISRINDYDFNGINSKYFKKDNSKSDGVNESRLLKEREMLVRKFHNMITSLYGKDTEFKGLDGVKYEDIIPMLSTCNIEGGYKTFRENFKNKKIGSEMISKEMYEERLNKLRLYIKLLVTTNSELLKNNKVLITNHQKTREDLLKEVETEYKSMIINMINKMRKSNGVGDPRVHR